MEGTRPSRKGDAMFDPTDRRRRFARRRDARRQFSLRPHGSRRSSSFPGFGGIGSTSPLHHPAELRTRTDRADHARPVTDITPRRHGRQQPPGPAERAPVMAGSAAPQDRRPADADTRRGGASLHRRGLAVGSAAEDIPTPEDRQGHAGRQDTKGGHGHGVGCAEGLHRNEPQVHERRCVDEPTG